MCVGSKTYTVADVCIPTKYNFMFGLLQLRRCHMESARTVILPLLHSRHGETDMTARSELGRLWSCTLTIIKAP